jgi:hypothetical protein
VRHQKNATGQQLVLLAGVAIVFAACSSTPRPEPRRSDPGSGAVSPLGLGYPDPQAMLDEILARMESEDFEGLCALLAGPRKLDGRPVPLVPGRNVHERKDIWVPLSELHGLRGFLARPWKSFHFGRSRSLLNDPPFIAVTVRVTYDWNSIPATERALLLRAWSEKEGRAVPWDDFVVEMKARERAEAAPGANLPSLCFVHLDGRWRLYLGPFPGR